MNYEKEYRSIVGKLKNALLCTHPDSIKKAIEGILHESNESEDERIRRIMLYHFKNQPEQYTFGGLTNHEVVAWLEKQKEQPVLPGIEEEGIPGKDFVPVDWVEALNEYGVWKIVKVDEQPAEWSEEDKERLDTLIEDYEYMSKKYRDDIAHDDTFTNGTLAAEDSDTISWLKSLPERFNLQPKQEWSEEDGNALTYLHELIGFGYSENFMDAQTAADMREWVNKSLRPQPKQEQQIKEGIKVKIHCRKDRKDTFFYDYDGKVGEVIHIRDAEKRPWGHIIVRLDNGCNDGFYEDELEVL